MTSSPDEANDADVAEQQRSVIPGDDNDALPGAPTARLDEANEADALEQGAEIVEDEEY